MQDWQDCFGNLVMIGRRQTQAWKYSTNIKEAMTSFELQELAGLLLKRDLTLKLQDIGDILLDICIDGGYHIAELMAAYCANPCTNNTFDLLEQIKKSVARYYEFEIQQMLDKYWDEQKVASCEEAGFILKTCPRTGDKIWKKY